MLVCLRKHAAAKAVYMAGLVAAVTRTVAKSTS